MAGRNRVYHWKHGWIPLTHTAALSKAKGSPEGAKKIEAKHGISSASGPKKADVPKVAAKADGAESSPKVSAPGSWTARTMPDGSVQVLGKDGTELGRVKLVKAGKRQGQWEARADARHGADYADSPEKAIDALYDSFHGKPGEAALARSGGSAEERRLAAYKAAIREHQRSQAAINDDIRARAGKAEQQSARAAELRAAADRERAKLQGIADGAGVGRLGITDPQANRLSGAGLKQAHRNTDSSLRRYTETQQRANALESKAYLAEARAKEAGRTRLTQAEVKGASHIQDANGWHEVVRVNAKTVTVKTPYSWTETVPIEKVRKVLKATPGQIAAAKKKRAG